MDNSFFVFSDAPAGHPIEIERAHICTWDFKNDGALVEFGFEISRKSLPTDKDLSISVFIPWLAQSEAEEDLYKKLSTTENTRFIFNDSIKSSSSLDGGKNELGVIHHFSNRDTPLCILPVTIRKKDINVLELNINLQSYRKQSSEANIYCRISITPPVSAVSMRKEGISKSTIVYDIKVNERRNIPDGMMVYFEHKTFCKIATCFYFSIIPNEYDIVFIENESLKSVRTLEFDSFRKYIGDERVKKDELIVVFNKKNGGESFSFFSIFTKEHIGPDQYILAILVSIVTGVLLFLPGFRVSLNHDVSIFRQIPGELYAAAILVILASLYFFRHKLRRSKKKNLNSVISK